MDDDQFNFYQRVWADYAWWCRRGFFNYGFERKLKARQPFEALRKLLVPVNTRIALRKLRVLRSKLVNCADLDAINHRSFAARVIEHSGLFTEDEVDVAYEWLRLANK